MALDPMMKKVLRMELKDARNAFNAAQSAHAGATNEAGRGKALKDMKEAAADVQRIKAQLKAR